MLIVFIVHILHIYYYSTVNVTCILSG